MSGPSDALKDTARRMMDGALARDVKGVQVAASRSRSVSVIWRTGRVDKIQESSRLGVSLVLYLDGRYTTCTTNDLRPEAVDRFLDSSVALCRAMTPDPYRVMPDPSLYEGREERDLGLYDPAVAAVTPEERKATAAAMESAALAKAATRPSRPRPGARTRASHSGSSSGFEGSVRSSYFGSWAWVSLGRGRQAPGVGLANGSRTRAELPGPELVGTKAAESGLLRMGTTKVPTASMTMLIENRAVGRLLGYLLAATSGRALQQKQSFLDGMLGKEFGSAAFDLLDEPFLAGGFGSRLFDGEGITARPMPVFEKGVFRNFYIDVYYGKKLELPPTTGGRSNLVLTPGTKSLDELVAGVAKGILVRGFIGGNSNSTTGDFSTGIYGTLIENGALTKAIAEMNVAGNHKDLWKRLVEAGNDPWPYSSLRVPSLVFDDVQFSGE